MSVVCASCGQETPEGFPRCANCGVPLASEATSVREERKVVTVLFCDLVGSTARAERADPEDVRALLRAYHERVRAELERFGGTVEKFIGDAVMALFGAPVAHEDDPERAVRAALAIRDWAQEDGDLQVRIGITTGEALVALGADPRSGEAMASGDVVNTAARLQSAAPVNGILVDQTTERGTRQAIDYRAHEDVIAKGKRAPLPAWEALAARSRLGVDVRQHGAAPLVGRDRELELLTGTLQRVRAERAPQLLTLVGAPGIGKSRLVFELMQRLERDPELVTWRQGRSIPYGAGVSFWALAEMVKAEAGILESDSPGHAEAKLGRALEGLTVDAKEGGWLERHLRPLVGLAADEEISRDRHDESFAAWRRFLEALGERRPLVLVFEDLHWADEGLLDFVDHFVEWAMGVPILVVCTARPELLDRRPGWGGGKLNASTQVLSPLAERETARLISAVLTHTVLPAETQSRLLERAGGNPLYAEQFARLYAERGSAGDVALPESVQGIIGARLDAVAPEEKELLQDASVVGKVFWAGALRGDPETLRHILHALERKGFLRRERRSSVEGEDEYAFSHALVRELAYGQIPRAARAEKHRLAAEWIESLGRKEDHAEVLAHHYLSALEYARAAGEETRDLADRAREPLRDAAERATALSAFDAAARFFAAAADLCPTGDPEGPRLLLGRGRTLYLAGEEDAEEVLTAARDALLDAGDQGRAAEAEAMLGRLDWSRGERDRAFEHYDVATRLVTASRDPRGRAEVLVLVAGHLAIAGEYERAIELGQEAFAAAESIGLLQFQAHALASVGTARTQHGDPGGMVDAERSLAIALKANAPISVVHAYTVMATAAGDFGDLRRRVRLDDEALEVAERFGLRGALRWGVGRRVRDRYWEGRWNESLAVAEEFLADAAGSPHYLEGSTREIRARIRLAQGDIAGALQDQDRALEIVRRIRDAQAFLPVLASGARTLVAAGERERAQRYAGELLDQIARTRYPASIWSLDLAVTLAELGRGEEFAEHAKAMVRTPWLAAAEAFAAGDFERCAGICAVIGTLPDEAYARLRAGSHEQLEQALAFYRSVDATRYVLEAEALLARSA
jgi:class 3 adenylate cyclase/tetratricopeptide (TPR) repeat protein